MLAATVLHAGAYRTSRRVSGLLVALIGLAVAAFFMNRMSGLSNSYLLDRGIYKTGWHILTNLDDYFVRIGFPFQHLFGKLGVAPIYSVVTVALHWLFPIIIIVSWIKANRRTKWVILLFLSSLLPYLPFTSSTTSRYTYLAAAAFGILVAILLRRFASRRLSYVVCCAILIAYSLDTKIEENDYVYRERLMTQLVADTQALHPELPAGTSVLVLNLPLFAVDRGIHFEAALRLAYNDPDLHLIAPDSGRKLIPPPEAEVVIVFEGNRIVSPMGRPWSAENIF